MAKSLSVVIPLKDILMDHQMPSTWQTIFRALLNTRPLKIPNNNNICKWLLLHATWCSMTVKGEQTKQSLGADHCPTATSMNTAVRATHCGIGIVSELIKWRVEEGVGGWRGLGTCSHLMPWQHCVPLTTKPQALSFLLPLQWSRVNGRDNCSQGIRSKPLLVQVEQRGASEQEAGTIYISSPTMVQNKGNLQICRINHGSAIHGSTLLCDATLVLH